MSDDGYTQKQEQRDREYQRAYHQWTASLTDEERARLAADGLDEPHIERRGGGYADRDLAESSLASYRDDPSERIDSLEDIIREHPELEELIERRALERGGGAISDEMLRNLAVLFIDDTRRALNADCLAYSSGLALRMGESMRSLARRHGISRQAFQKRCAEIIRRIGLPPTRAGKSERARRSYRLSNRTWKVSRIVNDTTKS